jgi:uncharacterized protein YdiU (UPF0061 family)
VSDEHKVWRDKSYSGHAKPERAAVVMRLAPMWFRLGSLDILHKRNEPHTMKLLVDHIIQVFFLAGIEDFSKQDRSCLKADARNL